MVGKGDKAFPIISIIMIIISIIITSSSNVVVF